MKKAYTPPMFVMNGRIPGQVPTKKRMRTLGQLQALSKMGARSSESAANLSLGRLAGKPRRVPVKGFSKDIDPNVTPGDRTEERLLAQDMPMLKPSSVTSNLGLTSGDAEHWAKFLGKAVLQANNEVVFRKAVYDKLMASGFEGSVRKVIFARALNHYRTAQKSLLNAEKVVELAKAGGPFVGPRGGLWADPQHKIPWKRKEHAPPGKRIFTIDRTKPAPDSKQREAEAQSPKKKIIVIDKTVEEKPTGGTKENRPIRRQPVRKEKPEVHEKESTPLKYMLAEQGEEGFTDVEIGEGVKKKKVAQMVTEEPKLIMREPISAEAVKRRGRKPVQKTMAVEQGKHVWGSRKDKWEIRNPDDLDGLTPDEQAKVTTKAKLYFVEEVDDLLEGGVTPAGVLMRRAVEVCIAGKPAGNSTPVRKAYIDGLDFVARSLDACKTDDDVRKFIQEWHYLAQGQRRVGDLKLTEELKAQTQDQIMLERGIEVKVPWQERAQAKQLEIDTREAFHDARSLGEGVEEAKQRWGEAHTAYMDMKRRSEDWRVSETDVIGKLLGIDPETIHTLTFGIPHKVEAWVRDDSLKFGRDNKYRMMAESLGSRMAQLVKCVGARRPKAWREAQDNSQILRERTPEAAEEELRNLLKVTRRKGKRGERQRFHWEREVPGTIIREGGASIPDPDPENFAKRFGFANVQFGGWVTDDDAKAHLSGAYGGLLDLSEILGVDSKTISLNGRLSIGIGSRGAGIARAHYESVGKIINITKIAGGGSLAHEWGHALDNILSVAHDPESTRAQMFMTGNNMRGVSEKVQETMQGLMRVIRNSRFYEDAIALSPGANGYYQRPHELFARAFEGWVEDQLVSQQRRSSYLVSGTRESYSTGRFVKPGRPGEREAQVYPQGEDREKINKAMDRLIEVLRETGTIHKALQAIAERQPKFVAYEGRLRKGEDFPYALDGGQLQKTKDSDATSKTGRKAFGWDDDGSDNGGRIQVQRINREEFHQKAMLVFTADDLLKAQARGGRYYRRVPTQKPEAKRKWRYFYDSKNYDSREDAHTRGEDNQRAYLTHRVEKCLKAGGSDGCSPEHLAGLVKRFGAKAVAESLRGLTVGGKFVFRKGRFYIAAKE